MTSQALSPYAAKRRAEKLKAIAARRARRRLPTRHALVIRELARAQMLPAPALVAGVDGITADERRGIRNKLKAIRRSRR